MHTITTIVRGIRLAAVLLSCLCTLVWSSAAPAQSPPTPTGQVWNVEAGPLDQALRQLMMQGKLTISYAPELVAGKATRGLTGHHTPTEALQRLLTGTGLRGEGLNETTFALERAPSPESGSSAEPAGNASKEPQEEVSEEDASLDEVVVTGTRIRGAQPSSPLVMISQEEMRLSGHNNLGEVIRALPQNFSGGQNPGVTIGAGGGTANQNITGGYSLNLRGLGPDATLTLLNGARLPYDGHSQATDVAVIPLAAIERFEVLLDGASAVYGSDAVGGVANIILKRDYEGAELTARSGRATDGGYEQTQVSAVVGETWSTGSLLVAAETTSNGNVLASQRDYLDYISHPDLLSIYPKMSQDGVLLSGYQSLGSRAELALDAFYTNRSMETLILQTPTTSEFNSDTSIYGLSPSVRIALPRDWSMRVHGFIGEDKAKTPAVVTMIDTGAEVGRAETMYRNQAKAAGVEFEGALFALPGGDVRLSLGGGWREANYEAGNLVTGTTSVEGSNSNLNLFSEIYVPLIGEGQRIPFVNRLSLNAAARYDDFNRFGGSTTPKLGVLWNVVPSVDVRASWGKSFKAPRVTEQFQPRSIVLRTAASAGITGAPSTATVLTASGGNPDLEPERAEVVTAGAVFRPTFLPDATIDIGWFDIDYQNRVVNPIPVPLSQYGQILRDPAFGRFFIGNPTQAEVEEAIGSAATFTNQTGAAFDPNNVIAIFNNHFVNASSQRVRGLDLDIRYVVATTIGSWSFSAGGSWITDSQRKIAKGMPAFNTAGVVAFPPKFKGRAGANWSRSNFTVSAIVNHLGGVRDTRIESEPMRDSMTTLDLVFDYVADPVAGGLGFNFSVINLLNERPPFITPSQPYYVNYDSTNYSSLGRVVSLAITKTF